MRQEQKKDIQEEHEEVISKIKCEHLKRKKAWNNHR